MWCRNSVSYNMLAMFFLTFAKIDIIFGLNKFLSDNYIAKYSKSPTVIAHRLDIYHEKRNKRIFQVSIS